MPRLYTSASDPVDFCKAHFPSEAAARQRFGSVGDGPDGRGNCFSYDDEHPDYADSAADPYTCHKCRKPLTDNDN